MLDASFTGPLSSAEASFILLLLLCCFVRKSGCEPGEKEKWQRGGMPRMPRALSLYKNFPYGASAEERVLGISCCLDCSKILVNHRKSCKHLTLQLLANHGRSLKTINRVHHDYMIPESCSAVSINSTKRR